jgi:hypothetical protein
MTILASSLAVLLVFQATTPTKEPTCALEDHRCKAALHLKRASQATIPKDRAYNLFAAHRLYLALFDETGRPADLCAARRAFERSLKVRGQPDDQRAGFAARRSELLARERQHQVECVPGRSRSTPVVAQVDATSTAGAPAEAASTPTSSIVRASAEPTPLLEPAAPPDPASADLMPVTGRRTLTIPSPATEPKRPGQGLAIAGGVTLGVGVGLTAAAGYTGGRLLGAWRDSQALHAMAGALGTEEQAARDAELASDYQRLRGPTLALAIGGGTAIVVGAVLVAVGAKRVSRIASRTALVPVPGGLALHARF